MASRYHNLPTEKWLDVSRQLISEHPLKSKELVEVVLLAWDSIFESTLGTKGFHIGKQIFPKPQIMGFLLHELIPLELAARHPRTWRGEESSADKDIVCIPDNQYSIEVKTSSNKSHIFGNRSYAQEAKEDKKVKSGYYLTINFEKFEDQKKKPSVRLIRFGWIDSTDWIGQKAATGQQSRLSSDVEKYKLLAIYEQKSK